MSNARELSQLPNQPGRKNMLFNGDMRIWQRSTSTAYGSGAQNSYLSADRWKTTRNNESSVTQAQSTDAPDGFANSFSLTVTTADGTLDAGNYEYNAQWLEGYDVQHLKYGTADAKAVTVSFWVKCSETGDFALSLYASGSSANYSIGTAVTINAADTWEYKTVTFPGLTTDTIPNDNALRFGIFFYTTAGSTYTSTDNTSWGVYASPYGRSAYGQTLNLSGTLSATFKVTGFQLEVGEVATEFEQRSYGEELALCQRYYEVTAENQEIYGVCCYFDATNAYGEWKFNVEKRANPAIGMKQGTNTNLRLRYAGSNYTLNAGAGWAASGITTQNARHNVYTSPSTGTVGQSGWLSHSSGTTQFYADAEL